MNVELRCASGCCRLWSACALWMLGSYFYFGTAADEPATPAAANLQQQQAPGVGQPPGLERRESWTSSGIRGFPDPPPPFVLVEAYPQLKVPKLIALGAVPASPWLLAIDHERDYGGGSRAIQFRDQPEASGGETFLETPEIIYGLAWDPQFEQNRWVYVGCNGRSEQLATVATKVLRFRVEGEGPFRCVPASRTLIIEWPSNGHNGGDLAFGPDGMLYVSAGDGTSDSDTDRNGQNVATLAGSLLRIDVRVSAQQGASEQGASEQGASEQGASEEVRPPAPRYRIPPDNPFVGVPAARGEIWAYGLRNPWRISYDLPANQLWVGNNGQDLWESVYLVQRGANYGWSIMESNHPFHPQADHGPAPISPATLEHHHSQARSLTGGHVYRGRQFSELQGAYVYGDYSTGNVWAARHDGQQLLEHRLIARSRVQIIDFGIDSAGELLIADHAGSIYRLAPNPQQANPEFPRLLSRTGLFADVAQQQPAAGVIPYSVNSPLWSDGALKQRWLAVPGQETIGFTRQGSWDFPEGTVLVKSFALPSSEAASGKRLVETRLLAKQFGEWYGYSYRWNEQQTDAELVEEAGRDARLTGVAEETSASTTNTPGQFDAQRSWRYPSRSECMVCHSRAAKFVLGLSTEQLHGWHEYPQADGSLRRAGQLQTLQHLGMFGDSWPENVDWAGLPRLVDPYDSAQSLEQRARSYLHTNCSSCHVPAGGGNAHIALDYFAKPDKMNLVDAAPLHGDLGIEQAKLVKRGAPEQSLLPARMSRRGAGQMPPLATSRVDHAAVELIRQWIAELPAAE